MTTLVTSRPAPDRLRTTRLLAGYAVVLGALPYLLLKLAWLSGSPIGFADPSAAGDGSLFVLNAVTAGMDLVGVLLALAFAHDLGLRLPGWLVLGPMWVGTGLLAPVAIVMPVIGAVSVGATGGGPEGPRLLEPWVRPLVYAGFTWQGVTLLLAFVLYARVRWAPVFTVRTGAVPRGATHPVQAAAAAGGAALAFAAAALHLAHAAGSTLGLTVEFAAGRDTSYHLVEGVHGLMALLAGAGILVLVHRAAPRLPFWLPVALTWTGAGATFAWGLWGMVNTLSASFLARGADAMPLGQVHDIVKVLAGLVIGLAGLMLLAEQRGQVSVPSGREGRS